jgi:FkbM family methyltransferase
MKIIYDIGSNNGDDIPYYLLKSDLVIAVEANPTLCDKIKIRFKNEINNGQLIVENFVIDVEEGKDSVPFYIHKHNHVLSQFTIPYNINDFIQVYLPSKNIISLIKEHGNPYYIKIDVEHFDQEILKAIFLANIFPPYLSAESHRIEIFTILANTEKYQKFKLIDGRTISEKYKNKSIETNKGLVKYSFPFHSAGPFGNDIDGVWLNKNELQDLLNKTGLGWKDIHVSLVD